MMDGEKKSVEEMLQDITERLERIEKFQKAERIRRLVILGVVVLAIIVLAIIITPKVISVVNQYNELMDQVNKYTAIINSLKLENMDFSGLEKAVDTLNNIDFDNITEMIGKLKLIDFDALTEAVNRITAVTNQIGKFFG